MKILGVSCYFHDAAAALVEDGVLTRAAEEERFTRRKHDASFPANAIRWCLESRGLHGPELDYVAFFEKPLVKFDRLVRTSIEHAPKTRHLFRHAVEAWFADKLWIRERLCRELDVPPERVLFLEHHVSHAAAAFLTSPYEEAAILTVDGVGEWSTATLGRGSRRSDGGSRIDVFAELAFPHSLGLLYSAFTAFLGFEVNEGEYKVMGLAPYGRPRYVDEVRRLLDLKEDGSFLLDLSYFAFPYDLASSFTSRFEELFGPPRRAAARFVTERTGTPGDGPEPDRAELEANQRYADIAASIQAVTEEILLRMARELHRRTGSRRLCIGGGVGYNCVANARLLRETPFDEVFLHPASGDSGSAVGAALYVENVILGRPRRFAMRHAFWGREYGEDDCRAALEEAGLSFSEAEPDRLARRVVELLGRGQVVGLARGAFEWGPRALGHRSILADPTLAGMKDRVNLAVKFREPFRPFAPAVPAERAGDCFELGKAATASEPLRFMLMTVPVRDGMRERLPAVTHVDGSARAQLIHRDADPFFHDIARLQGEASGVPAVLNTSFNLRGEPIVASPRDAVSAFLRSGLDALVVGPYLSAKP